MWIKKSRRERQSSKDEGGVFMAAFSDSGRWESRRLNPLSPGCLLRDLVAPEPCTEEESFIFFSFICVFCAGCREGRREKKEPGERTKRHMPDWKKLLLHVWVRDDLS